MKPTHSADQKQPKTQKPKPQAEGARKNEQEGGNARGVRAVADVAEAQGEKPETSVVRDAQEAAEHIAAHEREAGAREDARHGFTQDSGYAQSGGAKQEPVSGGAKREPV